MKKTIILKESELIELMSSAVSNILAEQNNRDNKEVIDKLSSYHKLSRGDYGVVNGVSAIIWNKGTEYEVEEWFGDFKKRVLKWRNSDEFKNNYGRGRDECTITPKNWLGIHKYIVDNELQHYLNGTNQNASLATQKTIHYTSCTYLRALGLSTYGCNGGDMSPLWGNIDYLLTKAGKSKTGVKYDRGQSFSNLSPTLEVDLIALIERDCLDRLAVKTLGYPDEPAPVPDAKDFLPLTNKTDKTDDGFPTKGFILPDWFNSWGEVDNWLDNVLNSLPALDPKLDWLVPYLENVDPDKVDEYIAKFFNTVVGVLKWYHYILDAVSLIAYLACPFTEGLGCAISVGADILNAVLYIYDDEDYYMAGMQMAFALVPGGEFIKYGAKWAKPFVNPILKAGYHGMKGPAIKELARKSFRKMKPWQLLELRRVFSKSAISAMKSQWKAVDGAMRGLFKKVTGLKKLWNMVGGLMRALFIFADMIWFDPEFTGSLLKIAAEWTGIEKLKNWGEAMEDWPKYGVKYANDFYVWSGIGGVKALVQTSIADCNNTVYDWEYVKDTYMTQNSIMSSQFNEEEFEKDWWNGWRPPPMIGGGRSGPRKTGFETVHPDNVSEQTAKEMEEARDKLMVWSQYMAMKACTNQEFNDKYGIYKMTCAQFEIYVSSLKNKTEFVALEEGAGMDMSSAMVMFITFNNLCEDS